MKKLIVLAWFLSTSAFAQTQPAIEELQAQYLVETGQLRQALGQAQAQIIKLRKENVELKARQEPKHEVEK